jgi:hypothetical protein
MELAAATGHVIELLLLYMTSSCFNSEFFKKFKLNLNFIPNQQHQAKRSHFNVSSDRDEANFAFLHFPLHQGRP